MDPRVNAMADVLVNYCIGVKPGDWIRVEATSSLAEPLVAACVESVLRAGGNPTTQFGSDMVHETYLREAGDEQLDFISPLARLATQESDGQIGIMAPVNTRSVANIDPQKLARFSAARGQMMATTMSRTMAGEFRWTGCQFPTQAAAQDAGMSLRDYEDFVFTAGLINEPNPAAAWRGLRDQQQRLVDWLSDKEEIHISGPGTDLKVGVSGRTWVNDDGHLNFPGGEVFTGPLETMTEGHITFSYPGFYLGREVSRIRLVFEQGRVVEASASSDEDYLNQILDVDEGARVLGELAFGTNHGIQQFTKNTLFDEKIAGTLHMALGRSIPETGGVNQSNVHWDMVFNLREGAEVRVDGQVFSSNGKFMV